MPWKSPAAPRGEAARQRPGREPRQAREPEKAGCIHGGENAHPPESSAAPNPGGTFTPQPHNPENGDRLAAKRLKKRKNKALGSGIPAHLARERVTGPAGFLCGFFEFLEAMHFRIWFSGSWKDQGSSRALVMRHHGMMMRHQSLKNPPKPPKKPLRTSKTPLQPF